MLMLLEKNDTSHLFVASKRICSSRLCVTNHEATLILLFTGSQCIAAVDWYRWLLLVGAESPLTWVRNQKTPEAAMFVPKQAPVMVSMLAILTG